MENLQTLLQEKIDEANAEIRAAAEKKDYESCQRIWRDATGRDVADNLKNNPLWWNFVGEYGIYVDFR